MRVQLCLLLLCVIVVLEATASYIPSDCGSYNTGSTMCRPRANCSEVNGGACGKISKKEKKMILKYHNMYRQKVAAGKELRGDPGPQPAGTGIYELKWSEELAQFAQRWAEQMVTNPHDCYIPCRETEKFKYVGQNVFWYYSTGKILNTRWKKAIFRWYDEVKYVNPEGFTSKKGKVIGHYTQLLWSRTFLVGCGVYNDNNMKCGFRNNNQVDPKPDLNDFHCQKYVCNYGPTGNFNKLPVYTLDAKCKRKSKKYPKLCAK